MNQKSDLFTSHSETASTSEAQVLAALPDTELNLKTICVVGAGPAGLACLKAILDTPQYQNGLWKPIAFESRENVGGIWLPAPPTTDAADPPLTPQYDSLTANLPHPVMAFSSFPFPPSTPVFPCAALVQKYLELYTAHFNLSPHIRLNAAVESVYHHHHHSNDDDKNAFKWKVRISTGEVLDFDLVIVANGHFRVPRYPDIPGLEKWLAKGKASHSAWYRRPHGIGNTVLVIGGGPSGRDISAEMCSVAKVVFHSTTNGSGSDNSNATRRDVGKLIPRGRVMRFCLDDNDNSGSVVFEDGLTESGIDHCILATGYKLSFPFLSSDIIITTAPDHGLPPPPPPSPPLPQSVLYNSTYHVFPLARHIFPLWTAFPPSSSNVSMAFVGLPSKVAPFPLVEAQARAIVSAFACQGIGLDREKEAEDVIRRYEELRERALKKGDGSKVEGGDVKLSIAKEWHRFEKHEQFDYRDRLYEFAAATADGVCRVDGGGGSDDPVVVHEWEKEMYDQKDVLRNVWGELVQSGEAEEWVRGVGEGGVHEWVELLRRMLRRAKEQEQEKGYR